MEVNAKVKIKGCNDYGVIVKTELKRFANMNSGKQIRVFYINVNNKIIEYFRDEFKIID
jgi:hypothetical protein